MVFLAGFSFSSYQKKLGNLLLGNGGVLTLGSHIYAQMLNPPPKTHFLKKSLYA